MVLVNFYVETEHMRTLDLFNPDIQTACLALKSN